MTHWLVRNETTETFLSEVTSMRQEASPDGIATGAHVWFDQTSKTQPYLVGDYSQSASCQLLPDGTTRWTRTDVETVGLPDGSASSYELPDGSPNGSRTVDYEYSASTAPQTCWIANTQISQVQWDQPMLSKIIGPQSETLVALSDPVNESVTNVIVTNNVAYTYVTTRPQRRVVTVTNALSETATVWFNTRQQLTGAKGFNGVTFTNFYHGNGWLNKSINLSAQATNSVSFANGLLNTHTNALGLTRQFSWDALERLITTVFPANTGFTNTYGNLLSLTGQTDRLGGATTYEYNGLGELAEIMDPLGRVTQFAYCGCGSPNQITDPANDLTGLRINLVRSDGTYANYTYDPIGQLTNAVAREPGGALRRNENYSYDYDAAGNLQARINATLTQTFSADNANKLPSASRSGTLTAAGTANTFAQSVSVNNIGADLYTGQTFATTNGLTLTNGNNQVRFKATDTYSQSVTITQIFNLPATVSYTYDLNGNLISDSARGCDYDDADQLIRITATNQWKREFVYDAFGRRIVRKEFVWQSSTWSQTDEVRYVWLGMSVL
jgi:YD repeat-containing protein